MNGAHELWWVGRRTSAAEALIRGGPNRRGAVERAPGGDSGAPRFHLKNGRARQKIHPSQGFGRPKV